MPTGLLKVLSTAIGVIGLGLLVMMVSVEGEPGLLPLMLVLVGALGHAAAQVRGRPPARFREKERRS